MALNLSSSSSNNDNTTTNVERLPHTGACTILKDRLFLSAAAAAQDETLLRRDGITHILNTAKDVPTQRFETIQVLHLDLYDSPEQNLSFEEASRFINESLQSCSSAAGGGRCLVHCNAGQSRSASMVIYYLMTLGKNNSLQKSFEYVKARKPDIRPNFGFITQLEAAEKALFGLAESTMDMTEYKMDNLLEILNGSDRTRDQVRLALEQSKGDASVALDLLLLAS